MAGEMHIGAIWRELARRHADRTAVIDDAGAWSYRQFEARITRFGNALRAGIDVVAPLYAATTEVGRQFDEIKARDGLKAALAWRKGQFEK